jgi:hypothetical protein
VFFPGGSGAGKNNVLISIAAGLAHNYVAMFDGDGAGDEAIKKYNVMFSTSEGDHHWRQYKKPDGTMCKLESLLSGTDKERLKSISESNDVKKAIGALYYLDKRKRKEFWGGIDKDTEANVRHNVKVMTDVFDSVTDDQGGEPEEVAIEATELPEQEIEPVVLA